MGVDAKHPLYAGRLAAWAKLDHVYEGEEMVKEQTTTYLPATNGHVIDGMNDGESGKVAYDAYLARAIFPDDTREAVEGMVGIMHHKPAVVTVDKSLEDLLQRITSDAEDWQTLLRRLNQAQLVKGRLGLLVEIPDGKSVADALPYIAVYNAESIINWSSGPDPKGRDIPDLVVIDESGQVQQKDLSWVQEECYRVLATGAALERLLGERPKGVPAGDVYVCSTGKEKNLANREWTVPSIGGRTFPRLPFVFLNVQDLAPEPDRPPLLGLANLCLAIYRGEADYRHTLFMQGQETLVIIGDDELDPDSDKDEMRIGAGAIIRMANSEGDVKYVGAAGAGLGEMGKALDALYSRASQSGMKLLDNGGDAGAGMEASGEALRVRVAARTASLATISRAGAAALEICLKIITEWLGKKKPEDVKVDPNLDFSAIKMTGTELASLVMAKSQGAPLSWKTIHALMVAGDMTELSFDEELEEIESEPPVGGVNPDGTPTGVGDEFDDPIEEEAPE